MNNKIKYLMIFSIFLIVVGTVGFILESLSFEEQKQKKIEDSKEIQKFRLTIVEYKNGVATVENGIQYNVSEEAQKQMILKKTSDVYVNKTSNEIVKIVFQEHMG